jgi:hypothetical protein
VLREQGFDVIHVAEAERKGFADEDQLEYAAAHQRTLVTFNARHFEPLAAAWFLAEKSHSGIVISDELPRGELRRRLENLLRARTATELRDTVQWLQAYK